MDLEVIGAQLGLGEPFDGLAIEWPQAAAAFEARRASFLSREYVAESCTALSMTPAVSAAFTAALPDLRANAALLQLAWHASYHLFERDTVDRWKDFRNWPPLPPELGAAGRMFYAFVLLAGLSHARAVHRRRGIPDSVTCTTLRDIEAWIREYHKEHGEWGLNLRGWFEYHFTGMLFGLGRLQFMLDQFHRNFAAFRNRASREVVVLTGDAMAFRADGQFNGVNGICDPALWTSEFRVEGNTVIGNLVDPRRGIALRKIARLSLDAWEPILQRNDLAISVHIPASGPLESAACLESFRAAADFFPRHFPDYGHHGFVCGSWLLDAQLAGYLPPTSNIVQFQRMFYLHPLPDTSDHQTLERVFGFNITSLDLDAAPQDTALRRVIVRHMRSGGRWIQGGGLVFAEDVGRLPACYA